MKDVPEIAIAMSVFNGEKYIVDQIESILSQRGVVVRLYIRDDGSTDSTYALIEGGYSGDDRVKFYQGENMGACQSFLDVIFHYDAIKEYEYLGFSDADDVWVSSKLQRSVDALEIMKNGAAGVVTKLDIVDENLDFISVSKTPPRGLNFENSLIETVASGASILLNKSASKILMEYRPKKAVMHDAWVYMLVSAFGEWSYLDFPSIKYRQHGGNVFGAGHSLAEKLKARMLRVNRRSPYYAQACEFKKVFGERLSKQKLQSISRYCSYRENYFARIRYAVYPSVSFQTMKANMFFRFLVLLGKG